MYKVAITLLPNGYWVLHDVDDVASDYSRITVSVNTKPDLEAEKARKEFLKNLALPHVTDMSIKDFVLPLSEIAKHKGNTLPEIKKVIFNPPATIVFWLDGTKTVVKCKEGEEFSEWAGIALCLAKKLYGPNFHKIFRAHCSDPEKTVNDMSDSEITKAVRQAFKGMHEASEQSKCLFEEFLNELGRNFPRTDAK